MNEAELYRRIVRPKLGSWGDCRRVENSVDSGMPDVNYAFDGVNGWLELKLSHGGLYHFEKFQLPWLKRRARHSKDVWVLGLNTGTASVRLHSVDQILSVDTKIKGKWTTMVSNDVPFHLDLELKSDWSQLRQVMNHTL